MSNLIKLYNGTVTADDVDGDEVSKGDLSNPIKFALNAARNEEKCCKVAIRCDSGYQTYGNTVITAYHYNDSTKEYEANSGDVSKWQFARDNGYGDAASALASAAWSNTLTIADIITDKNTVFWVKASSSSSETPQNDTDESIHIEAVIEAV